MTETASDSKLLEQLKSKLDQRNALAHLCGEILATLSVEANQGHKISELANKGIIQNWNRILGDAIKEPERTT